MSSTFKKVEKTRHCQIVFFTLKQYPIKVYERQNVGILSEKNTAG